MNKRVLVCSVSCVTAITLAIICLDPLEEYLSVNIPLSSPDILVIESWASHAVFRRAAEEYSKNSCKPLIVVCGIQKPLHSDEMYGKKRTLIKNGVSEHSVVMLIDTIPVTHNTLQASRNMKNWLQSNGNVNKKRVTVVTDGAHGRKTFQIYRHSIGAFVEIGMISVKRNWSGKGPGVILLKKTKHLLKQTIGWIYSLVITL